MRSLIVILLSAFTCSAFSQSTGDVQLGVKSSSGPLTPVWITKAASKVIGWDGSGVLGPITLSGGSWGSITGTLSAQTDLQTALDAKQPLNAKLTTLSAGFGFLSGLVIWDGAEFAKQTSALSTGLGGTGISTYSIGDLLYGSASGLSKLSGNTTATKRFLTQTGDGTSSAAPAWGTIQAADVPTLNQNTTGTAAGLSATLAVASGGTGITSFGTGVATWLGAPTKANLSAAISDDDPAFIGSAQTFSQAQTFSSNGAASVSALSLTGTPFAGGTATTTKPLFSIEPTGTTSTAWSTSGTMLGVNAASAFAGNLIDVKANNTSKLILDSNGSFTAGTGAIGVVWTLRGAADCTFAQVGGGGIQVNRDWRSTGNYYVDSATNGLVIFETGLYRRASGYFGMASPSGSPSAQTFGGCEASGSNVTGGVFNIGTRGTGTGTGGVINFQSHAAGSSGSTLGTLATIASAGPTGFTIGNSGTAIAQIKRYSLTMVAGTVTQASTSVTANSTFIIDRRTVGGTVGDISTSVSAGSSFTLNSTSIIETSTFTVTEIIFP